MTVDASPSRPPATAGPTRGPQVVPRISKLGAVVIAIGLVADVVEHGFVPHVADPRVGAFPVGEHAAHLIVLVGMVLVLVGVVADGIRSQRRMTRQEGTPRHAIR